MYSGGREHPSILFIPERLMVGGAERYFLAKANAMAARGCRVCIASAGGPLLSEVQAAGIPWIRLAQDLIVPGSLTALHLIEDAHHVAAAARAFGTDVVDCVAGVPFMLGALLHDLMGLPVVFETLSHNPPVSREMGRALRRMIGTGRMFAMSDRDARAQALVADFAEERVGIIPLPVDVTRFRPQELCEVRSRLGLDRDLTVIVTAARMDADKAEYIGHLIDALATRATAHPGLLLIAVGDGSMRASLQQRAQAAGVAAHFPGFVLEMADVYSCADIYVGHGTTALEAAACGRPVVLASWPPHAAESVGWWGDDAHGSVGTAYPGSTWRSLGEVLDPLLADPDERRRRGDLSRTRVVERHGLDHIMDRWYEAFADVANRRAAARVGGDAR